MARGTVYNPVVSEEKLVLVSQDNKNLLSEFVMYLQSIGRSSGTIEGYISDIQIFFIWSLDHAKNKFFVNMTKKDFMFYQNYLINTLKVSPNRIRRMRSALSSMGNYVENILDEEHPNYRNIVNKIEAPPKQTVREKTVLEFDDIEKLLEHLVEKEDYQKACVLALACSSGARKSELLRFKASYFADGNIVFGSLYKTPEKIKTKGRGGKMLYKYTLKTTFKRYLDFWLQEREKLGVDIDDLFVSKNTKEQKWECAKVCKLDYWTEEFSKFLGVDFYWHSQRHLLTTSLVKAGIPTAVIKDLFGWESLEMVSTYTDLEIDDKLGEYFGEEGIKEIKNKSIGDL